jgi:hypothetical protein
MNISLKIGARVLDPFTDVGKQRLKELYSGTNKAAYEAAFSHPENQHVLTPELGNILQFNKVRPMLQDTWSNMNDERRLRGLEEIAYPFINTNKGVAVGPGHNIPLEFWDSLKQNLRITYKPGEPAGIIAKNSERGIAKNSHQ